MLYDFQHEIIEQPAGSSLPEQFRLHPPPPHSSFAHTKSVVTPIIDRTVQGMTMICIQHLGQRCLFGREFPLGVPAVVRRSF